MIMVAIRQAHHSPAPRGPRGEEARGWRRRPRTRFSPFPGGCVASPGRPSRAAEVVGRDRSKGDRGHCPPRSQPGLRESGVMGPDEAMPARSARADGLGCVPRFACCWPSGPPASTRQPAGHCFATSGAPLRASRRWHASFELELVLRAHLVGRLPPAGAPGPGRVSPRAGRDPPLRTGSDPGVSPPGETALPNPPRPGSLFSAGTFGPAAAGGREPDLPRSSSGAPGGASAHPQAASSADFPRECCRGDSVLRSGCATARPSSPLSRR